MMQKLTGWLCVSLFALGALLVGCGGGGGGGTTTTGTTNASTTGAVAVGRVVWVETGSGPTPAATVQIEPNSTQTAVDGSFSLNGPVGATSLLIVYQKTPNDPAVSFRYDIPALSGTTDVGDLFIGPEKVTVVGKVLNANDSTAVSGATVTFAGRKAVTGSDGRFSLADVAYSSLDQTGFFGIQGRASANGFISRTFFATTAASGGVVTLNDILLSPSSGENPPPLPYNIFGHISPSASAPGTIAKLFKDGNVVRQFTVGTDGIYGFFVVAGSYVIKFNNPINGMTAPDQNVTLNAANEVIQRDVTLQ